MCEPSSIAMGVVAVLGAAATAKSQHDQGKFQEKVEQRNVDLAHDAEVDAVQRGAKEEERHRARVRAMLGLQRATFGANNVVSSSGTPLGLLSETAQLGEEDALTIRNNAAREAFGFKVEQENSRTRAKMSRKAGSMGAAGTALTGASNAYGSWKMRAA